MMDFLTSVTERSFVAETAIRPRVASLFEPVERANVPCIEKPPAGRVEMTVAGEIAVESGREPKISSPAPALQEHGKVNDANFARPVSLVVSPPPMNSEHARTSSSSEETRDGEAVPVALKKPERQTRRSQEDQSAREPELREDVEKSVRERPLARVPMTTNAREEAQKVRRGLVLPPKTASELTAQMKTAASAMNAGNAAMEKQRDASPVAMPEQEPSVHVTIGRIEVRATSESKQVSRPRSVSPVMSLEEYLHRRTQRGSQ